MAGEEGFSDGFRKLDDLVLTLKGLVLVRSVRERRGADDDEIGRASCRERVSIDV